MIPGPSEPEPEALASLSLPILPHYGKEWGEKYVETISKLRKVFKTRNCEIIILPSPGQAAVEMAAVNLLRKGDKAYVCSNGFFSEMIVEMIEAVGAVPVIISAEYGSPVRAEEVRKKIERDEARADGPGKVLFVVQNETSTGVANPVNEILRVCREKGVLSVLDSISAFGGMDLRVDDWRASYCIGYPSKALGAVFGAVPVSISEECFRVAKENSDEIKARFLNLNVWRRKIKEWGPVGHPHPSTMPTSLIIAMNRALDAALAEGLDNRYRRHEQVAKLMRDGLSTLGLEIYPREGYWSSTVSVAKIDPGLHEQLKHTLMAKYEIMISSGLGATTKKVIRIGHMGRSATVPCVSVTLDAMRTILEELKGFSGSARGASSSPSIRLKRTRRNIESKRPS